ncbi:hypothetical protein [Streptomyces fagopyri]|uniref:hypothetical protein n=1 Tax=Streptomyces fagopyri TaxID=2662397 RepID=UPI0033D04A5E
MTSPGDAARCPDIAPPGGVAGGGRPGGLLPGPRFATATPRLAPVETASPSTDGPTAARAGTGAVRVEAGPVAHRPAIRARGSGAPPTVVDERPGGLGAGVIDDTAPLAPSAPSPRNEPTAQELQ